MFVLKREGGGYKIQLFELAICYKKNAIYIKNKEIKPKIAEPNPVAMFLMAPSV